MTDNGHLSRMVAVVVLATIGGQAVHWFLTPLNHPDASTLRTIGVGIQVVVGFGGALWVGARGGSSASTR
jgi:hypothetical protein